MCQPLPLGRCKHGASIELMKAQIELGDAVMGRIEARREYEAGAKVYADYFNQAEGDEPDLEKFWNDAEAAMEKMSNAELRVLSAERDKRQKQLLVDSTNTGLKHLKEDRNVENRSLRIKNAEAQREWTNKIKAALNDEANKEDISPEALVSHKEVLYGRLLQEENASYEASQEMERRHSASATALAESISKMEKEEMENKDEKIEAIFKIKKAEITKATLYASEMAMHSARIRDLTSALKELSPTNARNN